MTRYELLDRIGVGGMAEIFRGKAVAAGGFEKPVAIKRILPHLSQDPRFVELLIAEAKVLSLLKHRNVVQIFDVGLGDDGKYFLVMEFVDGKDLGAVQRALESKRQRLPFDLVLHIGAEICEALEHAHVARAPDGKPMSLVHRDVSPSNVLLSRAGEVKLTDFGIAKRAEEVTGHGAVRGKFAYISPEQAKNQHLDPRSDVFSVGILLWELICNRRLFSQLDDFSALRAVHEAKIPRLIEIDPKLPAEIDTLVMGALARDKSKRIASAGQLGQKLRSLRYGLDVTVGDPATELAKIIESAEQLERESGKIPPPRVDRRAHGFEEHGESTVIRIQTADAFATRDFDIGIARARDVIDRFEEAETRLAQLSTEQLRELNSFRDSGEMTALAPRPGRPPSEDATSALNIGMTMRDEGPLHDKFDIEGEGPTRMVAPPIRPRRESTQPPPIPTRAQPQSAGPPQRSQPASVPPPIPSPQAIALAHAQAIHAMPEPEFPPPPPLAAPPLNNPVWNQPIVAHHPREAEPTAPDNFDRPKASRVSEPQVAGFQGGRPRSALRPWMLIVGALVIAAIAFAVTRAVLH